MLIVIHEASNSGLTQRADGVKKILGVRRRQGADDPEREVRHPGDEGEGQGGVQGRQDARRLPRPRPGRDDPVHRRRSARGRRSARSTSAARSRRSSAGRMLFAIDQQQYLQGYLPVVFAMLYVDEPEHRRERRAGADRPRDHQQGERGQDRRARREGHSLGTTGRAAARPPTRRRGGPDGRDRSPGHRGRRATRPASARSRGCSRGPDIGAFLGAVAVWFLRSATSRAPSTGSATRRSPPAGPTRRRSTGSWPCPVALLMIGGEFDLSAGVMIGSSGLLLGYLTTHQDMNIWPAMAIVLLFGLAGRASSTASPCQDEAAELHRHARDVLRPPGRQRRAGTLKLTGTTAIQDIDTATGFDVGAPVLRLRPHRSTTSR